MTQSINLIHNLCLALGLVALLTLAGCSDESDYDFAASEEAAQEAYSASLAPIFDPQAGDIPSTNDLLFQGSEDGTLNIPTAGADAGRKALLDTLNTLDGFTLTAPITVAFNSTIEAESVVIGSTVHVFEVTKDPASGAVLSVERELGSADMLATVNDAANTLVLLPLKPLAESSSYMVVLTNSITDTQDNPAATPSAYLLAKASQPLSGEFAALEPLRQLISKQEEAALTQGIEKSHIILSWTFTTQSVTPVLQAAQSLAEPRFIQASPTPLTTQDVNPQLRGSANVYAGVLTLPYYLDPNAPLEGFWHGANDSLLTRYNPTPVASNEDMVVPLLMTVPNTGIMPEAGWPVAIFQHGITRNRTDLLTVADSLAEAGFAAVAIDLPLHGITDISNPFYSDFERTFGLDLQNNETLAAGADDVIDASGAHFINLTSLPTGRDNIRQGIADLFTLRASLPNMSAAPLDTSRVGFVSISLGAMVGTGYLSQETTATPATLAVPGGGIARLLDGSETYGPLIQAGLAESGIAKGTDAYDAFMNVAQTVLDAADPVVLGAAAAAKHPIHMIEVVGSNGIGSDRVIPNRVESAPLSGTEPLAAVMGLPGITQTTSGSGLVRFIEGSHGSLLDPSSSLAATVEMQAEMAAFQAQNGASIPILNPAVIATEAP